MKTILHNLKILWALTLINLKFLVTYKRSFYLSLLGMTIWISVYIGSIEVLYMHTNEISGWSKGQMLILLAFYYLITSAANIMFRDSFEHFGALMRMGKIDIYMTKPASFQILCFFSQMRFDQMSAPVLALMLFFYGYGDLHMQITFIGIVISLIYAIASTIFFYHFLLLISASTFYLEKTDAIASIMWNLSQAGKYPRQIFTGASKILFQILFPMAVITSVPAEIFTGVRSKMHVLFFLIVIVFCIVAQFVFHRGCKKYVSAS